jgi:hypothetical protein
MPKISVATCAIVDDCTDSCGRLRAMAPTGVQVVVSASSRRSVVASQDLANRDKGAAEPH